MNFRLLFLLIFLLLTHSHFGKSDLTCPHEFSLFNDKCYAFIGESANLMEARTVCVRMGADLASVHSIEEAAFIADGHFGSASWIGLFCNEWDENWEWTDQSKVDYVNFEDRTSSTENCREVPPSQRIILRDDLLWYKQEYERLFNFTCMREPINCPDDFQFLTNNWCYASNTSAKMNYANATDYCSNLDSILPSVETSEVSNALLLAMKLDSGDSFWIGLECSAANLTWYWSNHITYTPSQANFADKTSNNTCAPYGSTKYALNSQGKWTGLNYTTNLKYVICTTPALPMPTERPDIAHCPEGYFKYRGDSPEEDWCFALNHPLPIDKESTSNYTATRDFCESRGEVLPLVLSSDMTIFLRYIRASFDVLRRSSFWIGLGCSENGSYQWLDGTPLDSTFAPWFGNTAPLCDMDYPVTFNSDGKWDTIPAHVGQHLIICAVRASSSTEEPLVPTLPESPDCPPGMHELTEKWCSAYSPQGSWTWSTAAYYCASNGLGSLPSVESEEVALALERQRQDIIGTDLAPFWIGLVCIDAEDSDNGVWSWLDGTQWNPDYVMLMGDRENCTIGEVRYMFDSLGVWRAERGEDYELPHAVCTSLKLSWATTETTESQQPVFRCDLDWLELSPGLCYSIEASAESFNDAIKTCGEQGATLPSVQSPQVTDVFMDIMKFLEFDNIGFWLGIECGEDDRFEWADGAPFNYRHFLEIATNRCDLDKSTAYYFDRHGDWVKVNSDERKYTVCERAAYEEVTTPKPVSCEAPFYPINGLCYAHWTHESASFEKSKEDCANFNGYLPSIPDQLTNILLQLETKNSIFWLGIHCEENTNKLVWDDGSPMLYENFGNDVQPELNCLRSDAVSFIFDSDGMWRAYDRENTIETLICVTKGSPYSPTTQRTTTTAQTTAPTTTPTMTTPETTLTSTQVTTPTTSIDTTPSVPTTTIHQEPSKGTSAATVPPEKTSTTPTTTTTHPPDDGSHSPWLLYVVIGVAVLLGLILVVVLILFIRYCIKRRDAALPKPGDSTVRKLFESNDLEERKKTARYADFPTRADEWEINRRFVIIEYEKRLGQGAFGSVYLGRVLHKNLPVGASKSIIEMSALKKGNDLVAVKMLHESADHAAEIEFREEIELMKTIGFHERLVNMLACVTDSEPMLLILEYCMNGDLLGFMRQRRAYMLEHDADRYVDSTKIITQRRQLMFAMQIAYGLEYLSSRGFVHRDIAARNILVDHSETCKIGDFGLCRKIGDDEGDYHSRGGRLPLKWMSPEAIAKYEFSTASDVWSYGVLLFEIITLGGTPYPEWPAAELLQRLRRGERMQRPDNCTDDMFELMHLCWMSNPASRPRFAILRKKLALQLEHVSPDEYYLKLNAQANYYAASSEFETRQD